MPVSVVCDTAGVSAAIRDSIANSSSSGNSNICGSGGGGGVSGGSITVQNDDQQSLQSKLVASAKRVLLTKVEYEEVTNYNQSFLDTLKSKYIVLKPSPSATNGKSHSSSATNDKDTSSQQNQNTNSSCTSGTSYNTKDAHLTNPKKILFPRENVQIGWRSSGRKWHVGAGMINVGNTCYLNSTLQALFHVPAMANWLMSDSAHRDKCEDENGTQGGCIICAMSKTLIYSQTNQCAIRPHLVYTKLKMVCKHLVMGRQEDAHEFLRYLVEAMEKSYLARYRNSKELDQYSKETTPLNQILGGYLRSAVRCLACGHISTTFQHFEDLLLDIRKANTLDEALEGYFARERLEDMGYKCESCKKKVAATKQFSLERAPISLCIQLKRFSMMGTKLNKQVGIRTRLDLTPYATKKSSEPLTYRLVSMVTHLGASQHCGHYTAIGLTESGTYYQFDDSCVRALTIQNVLSTSAYIMFYELEDSLQRSKQTSTITSREYYEQFKDTTSTTKINGLTDHNDNISRQYSTTTSTNSVLSLNSKPSSKLEINNQSAFIGPQLPDKIPLPYKESSDSHNSTNSNIQTSMNGDVLKTKQNGYVLNNSTAKLVTSPNKLVTKQNGTCISTNGTTNNTSSSASNNVNSQNTSSTSLSNKLVPVQVQKSNQTIVDKLLNHLKSGNNNSNNNNSNSIRSNGNGNLEVNDPTNKQSSIFDTNRNAKMESPIKNGDTHTQNNKIYSPKDNQVAKSRRSETPTYTNGNHGANSANKSHNSSGSSSYTERSKNLIRSLVPYETDDENDEENDEHMNDSYISDTGSKSNKKRSRSIKRGSKKNHNYNSDNESTSSCGSYTTKPRKKLTPPSPPVVESKTGYWQVETISTPNRTPLVSPSSSATTGTPVTPIQERDSKKNSFHSPTSHTAISPDNFYSSNSLMFKEKNKLNNHKMNGNGNGHYNTTGGNNGVVDELTRQSHRGYGAPVLSWNGHKSNMDKEVIEEKRLERKRELVEDEENEMDRGRQKKPKMAGPIGRDNPGYNPFQEYQNQYQNNNNRRWNNDGRYHNGPVYRQNQHYHHHHHHNNNNNNHHNHHNRNNNFRRNRFHQRPHHQRNGDSSSYHRRDS